MPRSETMVMVITVIVVVLTSNLAIGVGVGVLVACVLFARRVAHVVTLTSELDESGSERTYQVHGQLFFASSNDLVDQFDYAGDPSSIVIDMADAHIWDASSVAALDAISTRYGRRHKSVTIVGMNDHSRDRHERLAGQLSGGH